MSVSESNCSNLDETTSVCQQDIDGSSINILSEDKSFGENSWEDIEEGDIQNSSRNKKGYTLAERRQMPTRASKECSFLGIKRRTIMKPTKRVKANEDFQKLKPADIKKIYLNKKLTNFRPSSLETIYEETSTTYNERDCSSLMGGRKIKRSLSFSDGFRCSKTLVNKRRAKIKKTFGKRFALKKISLEEFITKLNNSIDKNESSPRHNCQMESGENGILEELCCSKVFEPSIAENLDVEAITTRNLGNEVSNDFNMSL